MRISKVCFVVALALSLLVPACADDENAFCDALREKVPGIDFIHWDNGMTSGEATWAGLFVDGITHADSESRLAAAEAVREGSDGYQVVRSKAPEDLRPRLDRLRSLLLDPARSEAARDDPRVLDDIAALRATAHPESCGWSY
jgi:hypothetical protein